MEITYRELKKYDAEDLMCLRLSVMNTDPYSFSISVEDERRIDKNNIEKAIESYGTSNDQQMLGAWNGELIGVIGIERYCNEYENHKVRLWGPYVNNSNRGNGIGSSLIEKALNFVFSIKGVEIITLETTSESNKAINLFNKHGFEKTGTQYKALCFDGKYVDLLYMQRGKST